MKSQQRVSGSDRVLRALLANGPSTVASLAAGLGLTGAGVRLHLDALAEDGLVVSSERAPFGPSALAGGPRRRGRPPRVFALTDEGRRSLSRADDSLTLEALRFLADVGGADAVLTFARQRADALLSQPAPTGSDPVEGLMARLADAGYAPDLVHLDGPSGPSVQLCQHQCAVAHVAAEFPQFCEAETEAFEQALGVHVTRLATIARGDGVCTTVIPTSTLTSARTSHPAPPSSRSSA